MSGSRLPIIALTEFYKALDDKEKEQIPDCLFHLRGFDLEEFQALKIVALYDQDNLSDVDDANKMTVEEFLQEIALLRELAFTKRTFDALFEQKQIKDDVLQDMYEVIKKSDFILHSLEESLDLNLHIDVSPLPKNFVVTFQFANDSAYKKSMSCEEYFTRLSNHPAVKQDRNLTPRSES